MKRKRINFTTSELYCTQCGKKGIPIPRKRNGQREAGHLKKMYCIYCQEETNHGEVAEGSNYTYEDFKKEFELGRFVKGKRLTIAELTKCSKYSCHYNTGGHCWNSNYSFNCKHRLPKEEIKGEN